MNTWIFRGLGIIAFCFVALVTAVALAAGKYIDIPTRDLLIAVCIIVSLFMLIPLVIAIIFRQMVRGITKDVEKSFKKFNPALLESSIAAAKARAELEESLRKNFLKSDQVTAYRWDQCQHRAIFIYESMPTKDILMHFQARGNKVKEPAGVTSPLDAFEMLNESLSEKKRFKLLGSIDEPVPCDVYVSPDTDS